MGEFEFIESIRRAFEGVGDCDITGIGDGGNVSSIERRLSPQAVEVFCEGDNGRSELADGSEPSLPLGSEESGYLGIGDDCAVLPIAGNPAVADGGDNGRGALAGTPQLNRGSRSVLNRGDAMVVTTDMLVEGVHFIREATSARELGAKSLAVNLSDVAAMGARPVASFLSIALPPECRGGGNAHGGWADEFMEGYREISARYGVRLAGGDTTSSKGGVAINVTAIGRAPLDRLKYRSGAQAGDIVVVGGPLGESAAGLADILAGRLDTGLARIHRNPVPQVAEGEWLGGRAEVRSMIDLSDGLASDLVHILRASGVGAEIDLDAIPTPVSLEQAVAGGEDYKLLFTVRPDGFERLAEDYRARFGEPLYPVGRIVAGAPEIRWLENNEPVDKNWRGFVHF